MDHFIFTYHRIDVSPSSRVLAAQRCFARGKKNLGEYRGETFSLIVESFENHIAVEICGEQGTLFCGRESSTFSNEELKFPYLLLRFGSRPGQVDMRVDKFGLFPYFFSLSDEQLIITNYLPAIMHFWGSDLQIDTSAEEELVCSGVLRHGRTLFKDIQMGHPLYDISVENYSQVVLKKRKPHKRIVFCEDPETSFYKEFKKSTDYILKTSKIRWINITGGADSRLIFSTLEQSVRKTSTFLFDNTAADSAQIPLDEVVVDSLKKTFSLNIQYGFPVEGNRLLKPFVGYQEGGVHEVILTGLYGGELVGGQALNVQPYNVQDTLYFNIEKEEFRNYISSKSDLFYYITLMTSSFMSFFYNDKNWLFPFVITQKKITPFLNTKLLEIVFLQDKDELMSFAFYHKIYRKHAADLINIPFHSQIARVGNKDFLDVGAPNFSPPINNLSKHSNDYMKERKDILRDVKKMFIDEIRLSYSGGEE